jgi:phage host-nuclease inhibitor protein Gam
MALLRPTGLSLLAALAAVPAASVPAAARADTVDAPAPSGLSGQALELWQRSREQADDWWQRSRDATLGAWDQARDAWTPAEPDDFGRLWSEAVPRLEETLSLEEAQRDLPEKAWFRRDRADAQTEINALLDETVAVLTTSGVQQYRDRIQALQARIADARIEIDGYRQARIAAPAKSMVEKTVEDYDRLITERGRDIGRYNDELADIKRRFAEELRAMGLDLSDEQVDFLLSTVVGDNIVDLGIVFDNVKAITVQLEQLVRDSGEDLQSARRYYGMYVILLRALDKMHVDVEQAIEQRYIPQINDIADRARALSEETRALRKAHPDKAELLQANLQAQQLTMDAAEVYRSYLKQQAGQVRGAREALQDDISTAWNTYETVRVSGELVDLVKSSRQLLEGLLDRQVPALRPYENLEMQRELAKLTEQLRASGG